MHQITLDEYLRVENSREWLIVDQFAGGGGTSQGIKDFLGRDPDIAINHDKIAISMHKANHPDTYHFQEDVWSVSPKFATKGRPVGLLWLSPDCKHFSKAKGSAPSRSREIRALAWVGEKWMRELAPRLVILENVEEFQKWGPLDSEGKPVTCQKGTTFRAFIKRIKRLGYKVEWKELRACDYGAPTIRKRLFLIARNDGFPIIWPEPTHGPGLIPYKTAADIIDWSIPCPSIFERKKPLAENTLRRIARGIEKYVINAAEPFIVPIQYYNGSNPVHSINDPLRTVTAYPKGGAFALAVPTLIQTGYGERKGQSPRVPGLEKPLGTVVAGGIKHALVVPHIQRQFGTGIGSAIDDPIGTITAGGLGKSALVTAFMTKFNKKSCRQSLKKPLSTVCTKGSHHGLVTSHLLKLRGTCKDGQPVDQPMPTVTAGGLHVGEVRAFLMKYYSSGGQWQSVNDPTHTITTNDRLGLVTVVIHGEPYIIADIGMRMLTPRELFRAQGFPDSYKIDLNIDGRRITKTDQVRLCGNSVCPPLASALVKANAGFLHKQIAAKAS